MTPLPQLPDNFGNISIQTPEEILKAQEELEKIQKQIDELVGKLQGYADQLENVNLNFTVGGQLKQQIIKGTVDPLLNLGCRGFELPILQLTILINLFTLALRLPTIPPIPDPIKLALGIQINLIPDVPSIAEFMQYVNQKIEEAKKKCQNQAIRAQLQDALANQLPFTEREDLERLVIEQKSQEVGSPCVCIETGSTEEEAYNKAEFNLRRVQKCCGKRDLVIFDSKQENGVFIVTVGVDET